MPPALKKILYLSLYLVAAIEVYILAQGIAGVVTNHRWQSNYLRFVENYQKPYREDTYGGKTPEETWTTFLTALKAGDVELASKYVTVNKREEALTRLNDAIKLKRIEHALQQYSGPLTREGKDYLIGENAYYFIPMKLSNGTSEAYSIVFTLNPFTHIWKILLL